jgi:hypothetical protein
MDFAPSARSAELTEAAQPLVRGEIYPLQKQLHRAGVVDYVTCWQTPGRLTNAGATLGSPVGWRGCVDAG